MAIAPQEFQKGSGEETFRTGAIVGLPWRILLFSGILFGLSLFVFFGFHFGYGSYLDSRSEKIDEKTKELVSQVSQEDRQNLISFYSQIVNLRTVLAKHNFTVKVFDYLEKYTVPTVFYTNAKVTLDGKSLALSGEANTMQDLIEQLSLFDSAPEFEGRAIIDQLEFNRGKVGFSVTLQIREEELKSL